MGTTETTLVEASDRMPLQIGGLHCLDFANTVEPRGGPSPYTPPSSGPLRARHDALTGYADLVAWASVAAIIDTDTASQLVIAAVQRSGKAAAVFARAIALREAIYRLFWTIAHGNEPMPGDLALLRAEWAATSEGVALRREGEAYRWRWQPDAGQLDGILWPIAESAVELLTRGELERVKVCPGVLDPPPCGWLFFDASRNRTRHWCSMEGGCGGWAKARRQNARRRAR